ncbi:hypothetical protein AMK16_16675 [Streptomyces sp. CB00455]|uniref:hypothetical protein n=1 Tax=Streptomyces sp. CB00455 TaxID=1703927 RepID=UPI00093AC555|nr:hypothetical protein [Streptomyces sp. CB00455]OKK19693.1 hypothetical protein AMK16_16675 [Streptomyces sp. CB00455]
MDTSWWPAVAAVLAVAVILLVAGARLGLPRRAPPPPPPPGPGAGPEPRPLPGDLWSMADGRTCLVLAVRQVRGHRARVAWITGKYDDRRAGVIPLPPGTVGTQGRVAFLEADRPAEVSLWEFRGRVGTLDPTVWDEVRGLGGGG